MASTFVCCNGSAADERARESCANKAIESLRNAAAERFSDPERLQEDRRFDVLRRRADYIQLTAAKGQ